MRLDLHTDYALRTLLYLAAHPGRASVGRIAAFYEISRDHTAKVAQGLSRLGYVKSSRGAGGGLELARQPADIRIGQVISDFEDMHLLECVGKPGVCTIQPGCKLRGVLAEAERLQLEYLNSVKLTDVVQPGNRLLEIVGPDEARSVSGTTKVKSR